MCRKLLYIFLVAITCCKTVVADNYAILVSAGKATSDGIALNSDYWYDLYLVYEYLLLWEKYDSTKVYVFYGDGTDFNTSVNRYKKSLHNWGQITDYDNSFSTMSSVIASLDDVITENDNLLFYWVSGHGTKYNSSNDDSYYAGINYYPNMPNNPYVEYVSKSDLVDMVNSITHYNKRKIFWMTCNSGAMGSGSINLNNNKTVILASCHADDDTSMMYDHDGFSHSGFNFALYCVSTGIDPCDLTPINLNNTSPYLQNNSDSIISIYDLCCGMSDFHYFPYFSIYPWYFDTGNILSSIFVGEEKELKNVSIDSHNSYWLDEMEVSDVDFDSGINVTIDIDEQCVIKKNTFVPIGTTLLIK